MKTTFRMKQPYADIFLKCAEEFKLKTPVKPERFMKKMKMNRGCIGAISGFDVDKDGLERKNPIIVALGDSVTAGHFESLLSMIDPVKLQEAFGETRSKQRAEGGNMAIEITDARECYLEKFRMKLIDKYEQTSVSTINAGIAGDNLVQMYARADRDIIRYQPDLVIINGSLNWDEQLGNENEYKELLKKLVQKIKGNTDADIVLLTPNGDLPNQLFSGKEPTTNKRVAVIRELAMEEQVCLVDVYAIWEEAKQKGCPWEEILANGINHPGVEGHEAYAIALMKLFE